MDVKDVKNQSQLNCLKCQQNLPSDSTWTDWRMLTLTTLWNRRKLRQTLDTWIKDTSTAYIEGTQQNTTYTKSMKYFQQYTPQNRKQ
jgi:hypothetical protein